jgi:hypothetical protein
MLQKPEMFALLQQLITIIQPRLQNQQRNNNMRPNNRGPPQFNQNPQQ